MNKTTTIRIAAILGALAVGLGAFGAHGLENFLTAHGRIATYETAVKYHFYHALALLGIGMMMHHYKNKWLSRAAGMMVAGIVIFSGSLYVLCLTNTPILGAVTPIGGVLLIFGWVCIAMGAQKKKDR